MSGRVYGPFSLTTWPAISLLVALFIFCQFGFEQRSKALGRENEVLDVQRWYSSQQVRDLLDHLGEQGRCLYATTEVTLDLLFPAVYTSLFAALIGNLNPPGVARRLVVVPICGALADLCENGLAAYLAWSFDGRVDPVAVVAAVATLAKGLSFLLSVMVIIGGVVQSIWSDRVNWR